MTGVVLSVRPAGDRGLLVELEDNARVLAMAAATRGRLGPGLEDVVPGDRTLLLTWRAPRLLDDRTVSEIEGMRPPAGGAVEGVEVRIPVRYDGPDLEAVAAASGIAVDDIPRAHSAPIYRAAFTGFAPGFAYLTGGDPRLDLPRRSRPRTGLEAGSVAIAAGYSAVYPRPSPGGWHVLGHTDVVLFDIHRGSPALIEPGARVIFEPI